MVYEFGPSLIPSRSLTTQASRWFSTLLALLLVLWGTTTTLAQEKESDWLPLDSPDLWTPAALYTMPETYLFLGELHGTVETPRLALGLVSALRAEGFEAVLAVEWPTDLQASINATRWEALRSEPLFRAADGRTSQAMIAIVRRAIEEGIPVRCFDQAARTSNEREVGMAINLVKIAQEFPKARIVVLTGNYHSRRSEESAEPHHTASAADHLAGTGASVLSIRVTAEQGQAWNITGERGEHPAGEPLSEAPAPAYRRFRGLVEHHQARLHLPRFTPSPPWAEDLLELSRAVDLSADDNPELGEMFKADQTFRTSGENIDWSKRQLEDTERRGRTRELLLQGQIRTRQDFWHAAFIFQHGQTPEDFLMAHTLACAAMVKGHPQASWIAAASLDRYLGSIGRAQIYGTQFRVEGETRYSQGDFNRELIPDSLRETLGVPKLEQQVEQMRKFQESLDAKAQP